MQEQLRDAVLVISEVQTTDEGKHYASTQVYRFDIEGASSELAEAVANLVQVVHSEQLVSDAN